VVTPLQPSRRFLGPGDKLGPYEVIRQIAIGGMAELYLARTAALEGFERLVCVKRILPQYAHNPSFVAMFLNEAKLAAALHHPNIAQVYDIGQDGGEPFFAMEYVHGDDLGRVTVTARENGVPISLDCALTLVAGLCAGLHHAHEKATPDGRPLGVVHRDVSPTNVLVSYDGAIKLVDFGIARVTGQPSSTSTGGIKGKISYMSPEQCRGNVPLDRRSDVFSVGTILYELTTGQLPFNSETEYGLLDQIVNRDAEPPSRRVPNYPLGLEAIVMRALSRNVDRRFFTALELQNQLEDFADDHRLRVSPLVLARLMSTLFPTRLEEWDHARAQGAFFVEQHIVRTLIESGRTPPAELPAASSRRAPSALDEFSAAAYTDVAPSPDSGRAELPVASDIALARAATIPAPVRVSPPPVPPSALAHGAPAALPAAPPSPAAQPRFSTMPIPNMPGAVPIVGPLTAPPKASAGTLVSSALQAGTVPPALSSFATNVFPSPLVPTARATPVAHSVPASEFAAIEGRGRALGSGELPAGLPRRHMANVPASPSSSASSSFSSSSSSSLQRSRAAHARPTLVVRVPRRHLWLVAALLLAGVAAAVWAVATINPGVDAPPAGPVPGASAPAASPPAPVGGPSAEPAPAPPAAAASPGGQAAEPAKPAGDPPAGPPAREPGAAPENQRADTNPAPEAAPEPGATAPDDNDDEPEATTPPARKRAGKPPDGRGKPVRRYRPDSKRDPRRGAKPELKEPSWNDDSPFMPVQTPKP